MDSFDMLDSWWIWEQQKCRVDGKILMQCSQVKT